MKNEKTNIEKLIAAAFIVFDERYSRSEADIEVPGILESGFFYDGHDFTDYAEGLDLSECYAAAEYYRENVFLSERVDGREMEIWITRNKESGEIIVRTKRPWEDEWKETSKTEDYIADILEKFED